MRVLVVGTGSIGARHARVIHDCGGHELLLADTRGELLSELTCELEPAGSFTDYREAFALKPDAAIICTPNRLHAPMAEDCAAAGCHLLVEKPIADSVAAADRIVETGRKHDRLVAVGYVLRFWPGLARLKELVDSGSLGEVYSVRAMLGAYETLTYAQTNWRAAESGESGPLLDYSHEIDYMRWMIGEVKQVCCMAGRLGPKADELVTAIACVMRFETGALGELHIDYLQDPARRELDVIGEDARVYYDFRSMRMTRTDREGNVETESWEEERNESFLRQFLAFESACSGCSGPLVTAGNARETLRVALSAAESARSGSFVDCVQTSRPL